MKLTNNIRNAIRGAILNHGFGDKLYALQQEALALREEAIERMFNGEQVAAIRMLSEQLGHEFGSRAETFYVNCGGSQINLTAFVYGVSGYSSKLRDRGGFGNPDYEGIQPTRLWNNFGKRLDLEGDDDLAKRVLAWGHAMEALSKEIERSKQQIGALLGKITTVAKLKATWPNAMTVIEPILDMYEVNEPTQLPAVTDLDATLGLPPSNDDTLELTEVAA